MIKPWNYLEDPNDPWNAYITGYYILSKDGTVYACGDANVLYTQFNQILSKDLGVGDKVAVAFDLDQGKGIAMLDSYGNVYTSGNMEYYGSPSFGENIARDLQLIPSSIGYGILKGTGEIVECTSERECEKPPRPQSKIVNNEDFDIVGDLTMILQKKVGTSWIDQQVVVDKEITIPAISIIKLDHEWNPQDVSVKKSSGTYRVYASFESGGSKIETNWEFEVMVIYFR